MKFSVARIQSLANFWTTKCTRCPNALDELDKMAAEERYKHIKFASVCCDSCDGAREIIEKDDIPRWGRISHYFMAQEQKEEAKNILGFKQVPFYVILNKQGDIVHMGSKSTIDFDRIPGMVQEEKPEESTTERTFVMDMDF